MTIRLDNKIAVVTGAGAGLGRAHALLLAARGAMVVVNDPGRAKDGGFIADAVVAEITAAGGHAVASHHSVAEQADADAIIALARSHFGGLHILVNNAGILRDRSFSKMPLSDFELVLRVHLLGTLYCTKAAWDHFNSQQYGRIVLTSSSSGLVGNFGQSNYGTAKTGMVGLMNCLRLEGAKRNVFTNIISPVAATNMTAGLLPEDLEPHLGPAQVAPVVAFLCSEACHLNGEMIACGGGHVARLQILKSPGVQFDPRHTITPEMVAERLAEIMDMQGAEPYAGMSASLRQGLERLAAG